MRVIIANFGRENYEWAACRDRGTVATMNEVSLQPLWETGDRETFIQRCLKKRTAAGIAPTRPVASRWFNLMTIVSETSGDMWIHRAKNEFWWTISRGDPPTFEEKMEPIPGGDRVVVCHKPCLPWSDRTKTGNRLDWNSLHPRAREFLFTEGTLQQLSQDNALYAHALIAGDDLSSWHDRPEWKKKQLASRKGGPVTNFNSRQLAAARMAQTAFATTAAANGQEVLTVVKNKDFGFVDRYDLEKYILKLFMLQEGLCSLTGLRMQFDGDCDDKALLCSLDRIDSNSHYSRGNLQIVCRFANQWKSSGSDEEFKRLINLLREADIPHEI